MQYDKQSEPQGVEPTWLDTYIDNWDNKLISDLIAKAGYFDKWSWGITKRIDAGSCITIEALEI